MKKLLSVALSLCIVLSLAACSGDAESSSVPQSSVSGETSSSAVAVIPDEFPEKYLLSPGTGVWQTELTLKKDGSFSGKYIEKTQEYSAEEGYPNGMVLICEFEGKFSDFIKVDEYTYTMKLSELTPKYDVDESWIEDGILYYTAHPAGIDGGEKFLLCTPDTPTAELDDKFLMWAPDQAALKDRDYLGWYGLYNIDEGYGFFYNK